MIESGIECRRFVNEVNTSPLRRLREVKPESQIGYAIVSGRRRERTLIERSHGGERRDQEERPGDPGDSLSSQTDCCHGYLRRKPFMNALGDTQRV